MYSADIPSHLRLEAAPLAHPDAIVRGDHWRFTVLTDGLVRPSGRTTACSRTAPRRSRCGAICPCRRSGSSTAPDALEIVTDRFHLRYDRRPFSPSGLQHPRARRRRHDHSGVAVRRGRTDLGGTARTLDGSTGASPLRAGVVSRKGVAVIDDSRIVRLRPTTAGSARATASASTCTSSPTATTTGRGARGVLRVSGPAAGAPPLRARQLVEPATTATPPTSTSSCSTGSTPRACRSRSR